MAPSLVHGDLRSIALEPIAQEACQLEAVPAYFTRNVHLLCYGLRVRELLQRPWDLVHCWEEPFNIAAAQIAWWTRRETPFVFWTAQNIPKQYPPPFRYFERYCLERASGWLACGESVVQALQPRGYAARPHRILPLGVDVDHFRPDVTAGRRVREALGWQDRGDPVVGYLGRLVPEKGLDLLMQTLDGLQTGWRAVIVGSGPMRDTLKRWGRRHGDRVRIVDNVCHDDVPAYVNAMDLLAAPSQTTASWREQQGRMLIEAFATGVPVVASNSGEIPFVVDQAGLLVPEGDVAAWQRAISRLLCDPKERAELAQRGLARANDVYAWPVIARGHLEFFEQQLAI